VGSNPVPPQRGVEGMPQDRGSRDINALARGRVSKLGYVVVLVGCAGFFASCFLRGRAAPGLPVYSFYRAFSEEKSDLPAHAGILWLFAGVVSVAAIAVLGIAQRRSRRWVPIALAVATAVWSMMWIGIGGLLWSEAALKGAVVSMLFSVVVVAAGTVIVVKSARAKVQEPKRKRRLRRLAGP